MQKIGITGGIGSGKTTVCKIFEMLGVPVYYADDVSRNLFEHDTAIKNKIIAVFGKNILDENNDISRKIIASIVFGDKEKLTQLNAIIHPAVADHFDKWLLEHNKAQYILKEAAILFESGAYKQVNKIITITAPEQLRISRVIKRDKALEEDIRRRIQAQLTDEERIKRSQFVIVNDEQQLIIPQVLNLHQILLANPQ